MLRLGTRLWSGNRVLAFGLATLCGAIVLGGPSGCTHQRIGGLGDDDDDVDGGSDGGAEEKVGSISVTPAVTDLTIDGTAQIVKLRARSSLLGDITDRAIWSLSDGSIGNINQGQLATFASVQRGGTYKVVASLGSGSGTAILNIKAVAPDVVDPSAPPDAKDWFGGAGGGPAPSIVYPFDNTLMAPNILQLAMQWLAGSGQTVFRVQVAGPTYSRNLYIGSSLCPGGQCTYNVDDMVWSEVGHSSLEQVVTVTVQGVATRGGPVGISKTINITFSPEDARGGLYYFSPTIQGIKRVPIGASAPVDFIRNGDETGCAGCHAVSRDGKQVAVEYGSGQTRTGSTVVDGVNSTMRNFALNPSIAWNFAWFNPTGDKLITNWSGALTVRNVSDGQVVQTVSPAQIGGPGGSMPEWSPDGNYIAFVRQPTLSVYDFEMNNSGDIMVMPYNGGSFGQAVELVHGQPNSEVHFWPSWSPDSQWLVFNSMTCSTGSCQQYNAATTRLRLIRAIDDTGQPTIGATPIELLNGTHMPNNTNNWPKFAPFLQDSRYVFVVYSAHYGWGHNPGANPQLFMFGIDLEQAKMGGDPSFQPFWLPFQDRTTGNHSAIWTTDVACRVAVDCPGEFMCIGGICIPRIG